jgi:hypothetical protein
MLTTILFLGGSTSIVGVRFLNFIVRCVRPKYQVTSVAL